MKRNPSCSIRRSLQFSPCPTLRPRDQPLPAEIVPCDLTIGREIFFSGRPSGKRQFSEQNDDDRLEAGDVFSQPTQGYLEGLQPPEIVGLPWRAETSVSRSRRKTSVLRPMISARTARIDDNLGRGTDGSNPLPSRDESANFRSPGTHYTATDHTAPLAGVRSIRPAAGSSQPITAPARSAGLTFRKLRRRQLTDTGDVEITGRD